MPNWSLPELLSGLHDEIECQLARARRSLAHPGTKGDASEGVWLALLQTYLPKRYSADRAHVVDSQGQFSDQIDVVVFDRQYSPFLLRMHDQTIIPAESVYAVFEAKQAVTAGALTDAHNRIASVRRLHRTSLPIPSASGLQPPKPLAPIIGGFLGLDSNWSPPLGKPLLETLGKASDDERLDIGCVASHGVFWRNENKGAYEVRYGCKPATGFLLRLIALLQTKATVPMVDPLAYEAWLLPEGSEPAAEAGPTMR